MTEKGATALVTLAYMRWPHLHTLAYARSRRLLHARAGADMA